MPQSSVIVPQSVRDAARDSVGKFFASISGCDPQTSADDHLDIGRALERVEGLRRITRLEGKKLLEVGSGFGIVLAVLIKDFGIDVCGVEPDVGGFGSSFALSRQIFSANGLDPERIIPTAGESLPFPDASFDVVYSSYVLEHVQDPVKVLTEAVRVAKAGGIVSFELPNHLSYFEGHYMIPQPPLLGNYLPLWVRLWRRDPAFARTLKTEINPVWCRRTVKKINQQYPVTLLSLGEKDFLKRLAEPFQFEMERTAGKLGMAIQAMQRVNVGNWIGRMIVGLQGFYPISMVLRREAAD